MSQQAVGQQETARPTVGRQAGEPHARPLPSGQRPDMADLEMHRRELTAHCYRMLGSAFDAEDAVQETLTRAWRALDRFEGRSSVRTWLYRVATNVCLDALAAGRRRAMPVDLGPAGTAQDALAPPLPEATWVGPMPDATVLDPASVAEERESVRLALVAALQHLPPRQRAVLLLREVLRFPAADVAAQLDLTVAAVNSALQRARATLSACDLDPAAAPPSPTDDALLARYVDAFERYDIPALTSLLHEDATQSMPPYPMWLRGRDQMAAWFTGTGSGCRGSRLVPVAVNGTRGFAQYRDGGATPWSIQVPVIRGGVVTGITFFLETDGSLFSLFGLPPRL